MLSLYLTNNLVYWILLGVGLVLSIVASAKVKTTFARYANVRSRSGLTGAQVAQTILRASGIHDVKVEPVHGKLTDHYDPTSKTLRLSEVVYASPSVAALGVAAHEVGHAIQHAHGYGPLKFRSAWVPVANLGSNVAFLAIFIGMGLAAAGGTMLVAWIGVACFATMTVFTLVTLPVEFDASRRALVTLEQGGVLDSEEIVGAKAVLDAAALTYVAAAAASVMQLAWWVMHLLSMQRRD